MPNLQNQSLAESGQIVTTGDANTVTSTMILDGTILDADINASANIALSKLATSTAGNIIVYNTSGVPTSVAESGDVTISDAGVTAIASNVIVNADINTGAAIDLSKLASGSSAQIVLANSTGVATYTAVSGDITITNAGVTALASNITISNNLTVTGDLTVSGNTTTLNTANLNVEDNFIMLNSGETGSPTLNAGIEVERGTSTNVLISWNETTDKWQFTNDGSTYNDIAGTTSPTFTGTVTLPANTVTSTMILDGTIVNADISTTAAIDLGKLADVSTNAQGGSYTLVLADKNKIVEMGVATGNNLTVPPNSSVAFPVGSQINILQTGIGQTTIVEGAGVTVNRTPGLKLRAQWSSATLIKRATDSWVLVGDLSA